MSGNNESKQQYVANKLQEIDDQIDAIEKTFGLYTVLHNPNIDNILNISEDELDKLTSDECNLYGFACVQYCLSVQKNINRAKAIRGYLTKQLDLLIAKEYSNYKTDKFTPYEIVKNSVINGNGYALKINEHIMNQEIKISSLEDIIKHAQNMTMMFKNLSFTKKGEHYVHGSY